MAGGSILILSIKRLFVREAWQFVDMHVQHMGAMHNIGLQI